MYVKSVEISNIRAIKTFRWEVPHGRYAGWHVLIGVYPDQAYLWRNYLFACGPCNGPNSNKFEVFSSPDGVFIDVTRPRSGAIVEPIDGEAALIDPRSEDPLDFLELDVLGTFLHPASCRRGDSRIPTRAIHHRRSLAPADAA